MTVVAPLVIAGLVVWIDLWVLADARSCARQGTPVVFRFGSFALATAEAWAVACHLLFVIFVSVYAIARKS